MKILVKFLIITTLLATPLYMVRFSIFGTPTNLLDILLIVTICANLWYFRHQLKLPNLKSSLTIACALILFGAIITTFNAGNPASTWGIIKSWLLLPILFGYVLHLALRNNLLQIAQIVYALILGALIIATGALVYDALGIVTYDNRLRGWYLSPNQLAMIVAPALTLTAILLYDKWQKIKKLKSSFAQNYLIWTLIGSVVVFSWTLWRTQSLGGILAVVTSLTALFTWHNLRKLHKTHNLRKLFLGLLLALLMLAPIALLPKITETLTNFERSPIASLLMIWRTATDIIHDNPLIGIGAGQFQIHYLNYQQFYPPYLEWAVPEPHNLILAIWLSTGLTGLIGFCAILILTIHKLGKNIRITSNNSANQIISIALLTAIITIIIHGTVDTPIFKNDLALIFITLVTLAHHSHETKTTK